MQLWPWFAPASPSSLQARGGVCAPWPFTKQTTGKFQSSSAPGEAADFWYVGCIDATLWWLIALAALEQECPQAGLLRELAPRVTRALTWLHCQEHPQLCLLTQNEASDWADIMPRSGFVLYSNALWYHVKRLYRLPRQSETLYHFNHLFFPFSRDVPHYRRLRLLTEDPRESAQSARSLSELRELFLLGR